MSGLEVTSFALGLLATLQQAVEAAEILKQRFETASRNMETIARLLDTYQHLSDHLGAVKAQYEGKICTLPEENCKVFDHHMNYMQSSFEAAAKTLARLQDSQCTRFVPRFLRAASTRDRLESLDSDAHRAASLIVQINSFLANAVVVERTAWLHTSTIVKRIDSLERSITPRSTDFSPSFVVPRNPPWVHLEYDAVDEAGEPKYCEGRLLQAVLRGGLVCALGMGGVGKSCALRGLAENTQVRDTFPGGVYYIQLGMEARVRAALEQLCEVMELSGGHDQAKETQGKRSLSVVLGRVRRWFEGRDCLFLVDDVWVVNDIDAGFLPKISALASCSRNSAMAFTTRDKQLSSLGETIVFNPREALGEQSRRILLRAARFGVAEVVEGHGRRAVDKVLSVCAGLPVALAVVGNAVYLLSSMYQEHREKAWTRYVSAQSVCAESTLKREIHEYPGLAATFTAALDILTDNKQSRFSARPPLSFKEMHRGLCVLQKQGWASLPMLTRLWRLDSGTAALEVANQFAQISMIDLELREEGGQEFETIRLHDLVQEFCGLQALQFEGIRTWHNRLLNACIDVDEKLRVAAGFACRAWWNDDMARDPYIRFNICRHLCEAGLQEELLSLLLHPNWTLRQLKTSGILQLEQDFDILIGMVEKDGSSRIPGIVRGLRLILQAARLSFSYVSINPSEFWFQMYSRLLPLKEKSPVVSSYLNDLDRNAPTPWAKPIQSCLPNPGGPLLSTIVCDSRINCFVLFGDASLAICGCADADGTIFVMEIESGNAVGTIGRHDEQVTCLTVAKADTMLVTGSEDATVRKWDLSTSSQIGDPLRGHESRVSSLAITKSGEVAVTGSFDCSIRIWNLENGSLISTIHEGFQQYVRCLAISKDEDCFFSGGDDGFIHVWSLHTGTQVKEPFAGHTAGVLCMTLLREDVLLTGSGDCTIRMWDSRSGNQLRQPFCGHRNRILHIAKTADQRKFVSVARDKTVRLWDASTGREVCEALRGHTRRVTCSAMFPGEERIATVSFDRTMRIWRIGTNFTSTRPLQGHKDWIRCFAATPDGSRFVTGSTDKTARVWDTASGTEVCNVLEGHSSWINCIALTPNGQTLVTGSQDGTARIWDIESDVYTRNALRGHEAPITCIDISEDATCIVTGSSDRSARVWRKSDNSTDFAAAVLELHTDTVTRVAFSRDCRYLATGSADSLAIVWSLETMIPRKAPLHGHSDDITCLVFSNGLDKIITGSKDKTARVWKLDPGEENDCLVLSGHQKEVKRVLVAPHAGDKIISLSSDNTIRVWNGLDGTCLRVFEQPSARFLPLQELFLFVEDLLPDAELITCVKCEHDQVVIEQNGERKHIASVESRAEVRFVSSFRSVACIIAWSHRIVFLRLRT